MAKFNRKSKLSESEQKALILEFCQAMSSLKNPEEAAYFLQDLISAQEAEMLAKRLKIAKLLLSGLSYDEIQESLKVGKGTIARVSTWLNLSGTGFRLIAARTKSVKAKPKGSAFHDTWRMLKRRYPLHFWPEVLIEEIVNSASRSQKEKLAKILDKFKDKDEAFYALNKRLKEKMFFNKK